MGISAHKRPVTAPISPKQSSTKKNQKVGTVGSCAAGAVIQRHPPFGGYPGSELAVRIACGVSAHTTTLVTRIMISWIANVVGGLEGISYLLTVVVGVGCLGYVAVTWVIHLVNNGQHLVAAVVVVGAFAVSAFAAVRVPIALWLFFGTVAVLGTAFLMGAGNVVLP